MRSSDQVAATRADAAAYNKLRDDAEGGSRLLGREQSTPDLTIYIEAGVVQIGTTQIAYAGGNSPSMTAPAANPRIDLITLDSSGVIAVTNGAEAASPAAPTYPADKIPICEIYHRVGTTKIYDADAGSHSYIRRDVRPFLDGGLVRTDGAQTIAGVKTFSSIPVLPASDPTTANQATRKQYVDNLVGAATGIVMAFAGAGGSVPSGWLLCDGSAVSRSTYAALFALISTTYGVGDGSTTFNVPNLKGKVPVGYNAAETEFDTLGETGGEKTHVLTLAEMAAHTHSYPNDSGAGAPGSGNAVAYAGGAGGSHNTSSQGSDTAHNNLQPYIALNFIIKT